MNNLGTLFEGGKGLTRDYLQARLWYARSAALGDATAMRNLGSMHEKGQGGDVDLRAARAWYDKAVAAGDDAAMVEIGLMYENGVGVARDITSARTWYERAAKPAMPTRCATWVSCMNMRGASRSTCRRHALGTRRARRAVMHPQ